MKSSASQSPATRARLGRTRGTLLSVCAAAVAGLALAPAPALAGPYQVGSDDLSYDNLVVTRYPTLADAIAGTNAMAVMPLSSVTNPSRPGTASDANRDLYLGMTDNRPANADFASIMTAWYFTLFPANGDGWGNPNNTCTGFVQLYDGDASTVTSSTGGWTTLVPNVAGTSSFAFSASGGFAPSADDYSRLWDAPNVGSAAEPTKGDFHQWTVSLTATGLTATLAGDGWYEASNTPASVTGTISGIFENTSTTAPANNGFYTFSATIGQDSWAVANGATWSDGVTNYPAASYYAAPVPEPAAFISLSLAGLALLRRRR